ncbi:PepSY-associated TM helix domain-containing protein [Spirosoma telluris]|uniref:PepSY-associated TM helix domain-containing protein n=1 Tax=Spirosoma telluris TaxID=2183553 RepID=UPI002FD4E237
MHLYLSVFSFVIVLFFAVTGLTLNHADWFDDQFSATDYKGKVLLSWVNTPDTAAVNKLAIVEQLRSTHGIKGAVSDFRIDDRQCSVSFRGPGYSADATIDRAQGTYQLTETRMGLVAVMNDLHKGRDTGGNWSLVIDGAAIFMTLVSLTGLVLLLFLKKRRLTGLVLVVLGFLLVYAVYAFGLR